MGEFWTLKVGRVFGIQVKLHLLFVVYIVVELLRAVPHGRESVGWTALYLGMLFLSVLLHEFGHCYAAIRVGGSASSVLMWPLGGLAYVDAPRTPRAEFIVAAGGPAVNVILALGSGAALAVLGQMPGLRIWPAAGDGALMMFYGINVGLLVFNLLPAFPFDGGRMMRALLWARVGFERATLAAVNVGRVAAVLLGIFALYHGEFVLFALALFALTSCEQERMLLRAGALDSGNEFGFDPTTYYRDEPKGEVVVKPRRSSILQRLAGWGTRRKPPPRELTPAEVRKRVDALLDKINSKGMTALTDEEREFLRDASQFYKS